MIAPFSLILYLSTDINMSKLRGGSSARNYLFLIQGMSFGFDMHDPIGIHSETVIHYPAAWTKRYNGLLLAHLLE